MRAVHFIKLQKRFSMLKSVMLILAFIGSFSNVFSQTEQDTISAIKHFGSYRFLHGDELISFQTLYSIVNENEQASPFIKQAQMNRVISNIFGGVGGFLVGYQAGVALALGEPNLMWAAIGGGLIVISIPVSIRGNGHTLQAIQIYNDEILGKSGIFQPDLKLGLSSNGIGLFLQF